MLIIFSGHNTVDYFLGLGMLIFGVILIAQAYYRWRWDPSGWKESIEKILTPTGYRIFLMILGFFMITVGLLILTGKL